MSKEVHTLADVFFVKRICNCGGERLPISPPLYKHKCERCKKEETFNRRYPYKHYMERK